MGLRSPRMPGFSPIVTWTRRWCYSIVFPPFFTIRGQGATSSTTSRRCYVNRYTADWRVMKMSTMPIVYRLIRLCGGSPERRSTTRMPPAPTRWVDSRPRCCPSRTTSKPFRKSMADGWKERCRKQLIDASFWIWTVQPVRSTASKKPLPTTGISDAFATIPCFVSNQFGDCEGSLLRPGNVHSADRWKELLEPNRGSLREENSPPILSW